jgi:hypothetical protein
MESQTCQIENMHPGSLGDGIRRVPGNVPDYYTPLCAELRVDVVDAGAGLADQFQLGAGIEESLVHNHFVEEDYIGIRSANAGLFGCGRRVEDELAKGSIR